MPSKKLLREALCFLEYYASVKAQEVERVMEGIRAELARVEPPVAYRNRNDTRVFATREQVENNPRDPLYAIEDWEPMFLALRSNTTQDLCNKVCGELPEGYLITLSLERDSGWVDLTPPESDGTYTLNNDDSLEAQLLGLLELAKQLTAARG